MKLGDAIDVIFSHNEEIAIWIKKDDHHDICKWTGMAWHLPYWYRGVENWKIFGVFPDSINDAHVINIRVED